MENQFENDREDSIRDDFSEHEAQHTSEEWKDLSNRCSECYKACKTYGGKIEIGSSPRVDVLEDLHFTRLTDPFNA